MDTKRKPHWDWFDIHACAVDYKVRTARKQRECDSCDDPIEVGQRYVHVVWNFPWTMIADDVDDEGRVVGSPAGEWTTVDIHHNCVKEAEPW